MMLKQTMESPDRKIVFFPGDDKSAVQLGSYQEMVFKRKKMKVFFLNINGIFPMPFGLRIPYMENPIQAANYYLMRLLD